MDIYYISITFIIVHKSTVEHGELGPPVIQVANAEQKIVELSGTIRKFPKFNNAHQTDETQKRYQGDISFLCPPVIKLIKAQVCDKVLLLLYGIAGFRKMKNMVTPGQCTKLNNI